MRLKNIFDKFQGKAEKEKVNKEQADKQKNQDAARSQVADAALFIYSRLAPGASLILHFKSSAIQQANSPALPDGCIVITRPAVVESLNVKLESDKAKEPPAPAAPPAA